MSYEADVFLAPMAAVVDLIDATIGEGLPFQRAYGYQVHCTALDVNSAMDAWSFYISV